MKRQQAAYSVSDLAKLMGWSRQTVRRWLESEGIKTVRLGVKTVVPLTEFTGANLSLLDSGILLDSLSSNHGQKSGRSVS